MTGGKDSGDNISVPALANNDNSGELMMAMMGAMQTMSGSQTALPTIDEAPAVVAADEVDWVGSTDKLNAQAKADYAEDESNRKGRLNTLHAVQDDEDPETTGSLLA